MNPPGPLQGVLVLAIEQAVAAPLATCRLGDAGARVIKVERTTGDFARAYDRAANGESAYFVWLNRGKESLVADIKDPKDRALLLRILEHHVTHRRVCVLEKGPLAGLSSTTSLCFTRV